VRIASIAVFVTGLAAAIWSGMATYNAVGLYGGPVATGFHREWDTAAKKYILVHETTTAAGGHLRRVYSDDLREVLQSELTGGSLGPVMTLVVAADASRRVGFSSANDNIIDAWSATDPKTGVMTVEMSTKRDGKIDRWERYEKGVLVRVDLDTDGNGKPDRWMTYQDGILMDTFIDANEDGKPDGPPTP
jgi:hypothetical protein